MFYQQLGVTLKNWKGGIYRSDKCVMNVDGQYVKHNRNVAGRKGDITRAAYWLCCLRLGGCCCVSYLNFKTFALFVRCLKFNVSYITIRLAMHKQSLAMFLLQFDFRLPLEKRKAYVWKK